MNTSIQSVEILRFWYGAWPFKLEMAKNNANKWFNSSDALDTEIREQFGQEIKNALEQKNKPNTLEDKLATILLLDQLTRNCYRGQGQAFAGDHMALAICQDIINAKQQTTLPLMVAAFALMPLQHSEDINIQMQSIAEFNALLHRAKQESPDDIKTMKGFADSATQHQEIIAQFSRYPHRNEALKRFNTEAENSYLNNNGKRFGQ